MSKFCKDCVNCEDFCSNSELCIFPSSEWLCKEFPKLDAVQGVNTFETCYEIQRRMDNDCKRFKDKDVKE
jgi:hypothetical protein